MKTDSRGRLSLQVFGEQIARVLNLFLHSSVFATRSVARNRTVGDACPYNEDADSRAPHLQKILFSLNPSIAGGASPCPTRRIKFCLIRSSRVAEGVDPYGFVETCSHVSR